MPRRVAPAGARGAGPIGRRGEEHAAAVSPHVGAHARARTDHRGDAGARVAFPPRKGGGSRPRPLRTQMYTCGRARVPPFRQVTDNTPPTARGSDHLTADLCRWPEDGRPSTPDRMRDRRSGGAATHVARGRLRLRVTRDDLRVSARVRNLHLFDRSRVHRQVQVQLGGAEWSIRTDLSAFSPYSTGRMRRVGGQTGRTRTPLSAMTRRAGPDLGRRIRNSLNDR